ncbi:F-box/LRR-repeat protein 12-like isoform X2 [Portunus trituberculatus]|uniref:F-box/LRR-repeat protein 12-like isoform X2 n=1 Tax=Portunus trituberculatus TaxID=210409 RepID=UPI001E1CD0F9|nr:F-box/LRR-repeat protein 12-like isoform X2 [Portunus trituberculatus]
MSSIRAVGRLTRPSPSGDGVVLSGVLSGGVLPTSDLGTNYALGGFTMSCVSLLELPESVLLQVFSYLCPVDLFHIARIHPRLARLVGDLSLWRHVDFGRAPLSLQFLHKFVKFLGPHTLTITITGFVRPSSRLHPKGSKCISEAFLTSLKRRCPHLQELNLHRCYIDASTTKFSTLPASLKKLSLCGSALFNLPQNRVVVLASPFFRLEKHLPVLEEVVLEGCGAWLTPQDLTLLMSHCSALQVGSGSGLSVHGEGLRPC